MKNLNLIFLAAGLLIVAAFLAYRRFKGREA
jgi:hypothetical protein